MENNQEQELIPKQNEIAAYDPFREQLRELKKTNDQAIFDYEDPVGNKEARSHVYKLRQTKASVDRVRKKEKQDALEYGRKVDAEARDIIGQIEEMIDRHQGPLDAIEQREKDRIAKHEADLAEIEEAGNHTAENWMELPVETMRDRLAEIEAEPITEKRWEEYVASAAGKKDAAVTQIREAISRRERYDAEQAELKRLRQEEEERQRKEEQQRIEREAEERARKQAQEEAERKAKEEREAAERRELELRRQNEEAERQRKEAEERAERAREEAQREAEEKARKEKEEAEKRAANKRHRTKVDKAAIKALTDNGIDEDTAKRVVDLIGQGKIPYVSIEY